MSRRPPLQRPLLPLRPVGRTGDHLQPRPEGTEQHPPLRPHPAEWTGVLLRPLQGPVRQALMPLATGAEHPNLHRRERQRRQEPPVCPEVAPPVTYRTQLRQGHTPPTLQALVADLHAQALHPAHTLRLRHRFSCRLQGWRMAAMQLIVERCSSWSFRTRNCGEG